MGFLDDVLGAPGAVAGGLGDIRQSLLRGSDWQQNEQLQRQVNIARQLIGAGNYEDGFRLLQDAAGQVMGGTEGMTGMQPALTSAKAGRAAETAQSQYTADVFTRGREDLTGSSEPRIWTHSARGPQAVPFTPAEPDIQLVDILNTETGETEKHRIDKTTGRDLGIVGVTKAAEAPERNTRIVDSYNDETGRMEKRLIDLDTQEVIGVVGQGKPEGPKSTDDLVADFIRSLPEDQRNKVLGQRATGVQVINAPMNPNQLLSFAKTLYDVATTPEDIQKVTKIVDQATKELDQRTKETSGRGLAPMSLDPEQVQAPELSPMPSNTEQTANQRPPGIPESDWKGLSPEEKQHIKTYLERGGDLKKALQEIRRAKKAGKKTQ